MKRHTAKEWTVEEFDNWVAAGNPLAWGSIQPFAIFLSFLRAFA